MAKVAWLMRAGSACDIVHLCSQKGHPTGLLLLREVLSRHSFSTGLRFPICKAQNTLVSHTFVSGSLGYFWQEGTMAQVKIRGSKYGKKILRGRLRVRV